ncbi:hypothetical protein BDF19DRAFT_151471 [Syncephalis fuscata]|nr:hypothetical protein BDF19DRAFT_151471 [Syncephalis fuscata]
MKDFFQKLLIQHPTVILTTVENISHSDALVRMTCIEAWNELIVANEWAQSWFASSHKGPYFVAHTLEDSSTYVMIDGCQFLTKILIAPSNLSLDVIREQIVNELDLLDALSCYLYDEGEDGDAQALVALEFLWTINQTKSPKAYLFLLESQLLFRYKKLLLHPSKMVRTKIMDILEQGIRWWPEPHSVLGIETCFVTTFDNISANTFLFGKEIQAGLKGEHDAIDWYDAARLAMLACRYYQPVSGSEDLWQCFYTVFWRSLSINISDTNETSNSVVFSGLKSYESWLSTVVSHVSTINGHIIIVM